jgi:ABC-type multidrug transport system ATPase subunit
MKISLEHTGKRFLRHWVFKDISYTFTGPGSYALLGANGSGKSTLMRLIAAMQAPSSGKISYIHNDVPAVTEQIFSLISYCAPGMELVEELTLREFLHFHFAFKPILPGTTPDDIIDRTGLNADAEKPIGEYSSGMKQRVKLAQAIYTDVPVLLLDEPCTNLDQEGVAQYQSWIERYTKDRLVIVASNDEREYAFCQEQIHIERYKL